MPAASLLGLGWSQLAGAGLEAGVPCCAGASVMPQHPSLSLLVGSSVGATLPRSCSSHPPPCRLPLSLSSPPLSAPAQVPYFPPLQSGADFTPQRCTEIVRQVAKRPDLELEASWHVLAVGLACIKAGWGHSVLISRDHTCLLTFAGVCWIWLQVRTVRPWTMAGRVAHTYQQVM